MSSSMAIYAHLLVVEDGKTSLYQYYDLPFFSHSKGTHLLSRFLIYFSHLKRPERPRTMSVIDYFSEEI